MQRLKIFEVLSSILPHLILLTGTSLFASRTWNLTVRKDVEWLSETSSNSKQWWPDYKPELESYLIFTLVPSFRESEIQSHTLWSCMEATDKASVKRTWGVILLLSSLSPWYKTSNNCRQGSISLHRIENSKGSSICTVISPGIKEMRSNTLYCKD